MADKIESISVNQAGEIPLDNKRSTAAETVIDIPETIVDASDNPLFLAASELTFDAASATATEGRSRFILIT